MSYRIHTATATDVLVQRGTDAEIDAAMGGYEGDPDNPAVHLVLNDPANLEAMVLVGTPGDLRAFADRLLATLLDLPTPSYPHDPQG